MSHEFIAAARIVWGRSSAATEFEINVRVTFARDDATTTTRACVYIVTLA